MYILLVVARMIINLVAIKWPSVIKVTFYIEFFIFIAADPFIIVDAPMEREFFLVLGSIYLNFFMCYNSWKIDIPLSLLSMMMFYISRYAFNGEEAKPLALHCFVMIMWLTPCLIISHIAIIKIGTIMAENEVLRLGNHSLLNNLKERVIITEEKSNKILYSNVIKEGKSESGGKSEEISPNTLKQEIAQLIDDQDAPIFGMIKKNIFHEKPIDSGALLKKLDLEDSGYYSIKEIVDMGQKNESML